MFDFQEKIQKEIWILHPITPKPRNWLLALKHVLMAILADLPGIHYLQSLCFPNFLFPLMKKVKFLSYLDKL